MAEKCFGCHTQTKMGGLEMTSRRALLKGGNSGPAVEPLAPERSLLIRAVRYQDPRLKMPPTERLSPQQIKILTKWVEDGVVWPESPSETNAEADSKFVITEDHRKFWAFQPVGKSVPPAGIGTPIDRFLGAKLEEAGLAPAPPAERRTLLRRVYYDLIGLPPTPGEVEAFQADESQRAFADVVDRLLADPRYGERWGRHWLDVTRYSDDRLNSTQDEPYPNAFRYRDWVIGAFNDDMPYDLFLKAQLAGDQLPKDERGGRTSEELVGGLGMFALSPKFQDDRIDFTGRGLLGLTIGCAQCHDHKFDPIPTEDYYALLGIFNSTKVGEHPLAPEDVVAEYETKKKSADKANERLRKFLETQSLQLVDTLAAATAEYLLTAWRVSGPEQAEPAAAASAAKLDAETLERWVAYLNGKPKNHKLLDEWHTLLSQGAAEEEIARFGQEIERRIIYLVAKKKRIEHENELRLGGDKSGKNLRRTEQLALPREEFYLWNDVASSNSRKIPRSAEQGILWYGDKALERFLSGVWLNHVNQSRRRVAELEALVPEKYPFHHVISDIERPANEHVHLRGNADNLGEEIPRRFLRILDGGEPRVFREGSGRLELARAIASPENPLTARVIVNRIWLHHFGRGIVGTPSNFGLMGERPSHPKLLDYLARRLIEGGWSMKTLHREILLAEAYRRSARAVEAEFSRHHEVDPENKLLWRANRRRLDVESLRDSLLYVSGRLSEERGGPPRRWDEDQSNAEQDAEADAENLSRTVYSFVSRRRLDQRLGLFDFPNPNTTSPRRIGTNTPLQGLFFLNSELVMRTAQALVERLAADVGPDPAIRIERAYLLLFGRSPTAAERALAAEFLERNTDAWPRLAQAWLSSNEFRYVD